MFGTTILLLTAVIRALKWGPRLLGLSIPLGSTNIRRRKVFRVPMGVTSGTLACDSFVHVKAGKSSAQSPYRALRETWYDGNSCFWNARYVITQ